MLSCMFLMHIRDIVLYVARALNYIDCRLITLKFGSGTSKVTLHIRIREGALEQHSSLSNCQIAANMLLIRFNEILRGELNARGDIGHKLCEDNSVVCIFGQTGG